MSTSIRSAALDPAAFKTAFRHHPGGVALITADDGSGPVALTATSVISISAVPPMLVFSLSALSSSTPTIKRSETVVIHLLDASNIELARLGATSGVDRFADETSWSRLDTGEPYFTAASNRIRGEIVDRIESGASTLIAVLALEATLDEESAPKTEPLVYHDRAFHRLGDHSRI